MIWLTADLHLNHYNILTFEHDNLQRNGFGHIDTIDAYNKMIISRVNMYVQPHDTLYILGDFAFGGIDKIAPLVSQINGRKILIFGNHDKYSLIQAKTMGFAEVHESPVYLPGCHGKVILSHYPVLEAYNNPYIALNIHGHLHNSKLDLPNYLNANIAMNEYTPISIQTLKPRIESCGKSRREPWLHEWYASHTVFPHDTKNAIVDSTGHLLIEETKQMKNITER